MSEIPEIQEAIDLLKWQLGVFAASKGLMFNVEFYPDEEDTTNYLVDYYQLPAD